MEKELKTFFGNCSSISELFVRCLQWLIKQNIAEKLGKYKYAITTPQGYVFIIYNTWCTYSIYSILDRTYILF